MHRLRWVSTMAPAHDGQLILGVSFELSWDRPPEPPQVASCSVATEKLASPEAGDTTRQESDELRLEPAQRDFCHVLLVKEGGATPPPPPPKGWSHRLYLLMGECLQKNALWGCCGFWRRQPACFPISTFPSLWCFQNVVGFGGDSLYRAITQP